MRNSSDQLPKLGKMVFHYSRSDSEVILYPTIHDDLNFSNHLRKIINTVFPMKIALELPIELRAELDAAVHRLPAFSLLYRSDGRQFPDTQFYVIQPGEVMFWGQFIAEEMAIPVQYVDQLTNNISTLSLPLDYYQIAAIGWGKFWELQSELIDKHTQDSQQVQRSRHMAGCIMGGERTMLIFGAAHWPVLHAILLENGYVSKHTVFDEMDIVIPEKTTVLTQNSGTWRLADIHPHTIHLSTTSLPFHISKMITNDLEGKELNELDNIRELFFVAEKKYREKFDDKIALGSYIRLFQYLRNLCLLNSTIVPHLYDMILAGKGMVDDDYAYEVFRTAITYPHLPNVPLGEEIRFLPDASQGEVINFAFKRRYRRPILKEVERDEFDPIPEEEYSGQWKEIWDKYSENGYVSYPPEDEYLEKYLRFLEKKLQEILREERSSTEEFSASLEDGIDWRETIARFHEKKIYVKKLPHQVPQIGCIIVQFLEEPISDYYSYHTTLYAEHEKESHISILTTEVGKEFVGPGISRVKYAAIISQFPPIGYPVRIPYSEDDLKIKLLYAAMNMSLSNIIGFVSPKPPSPAHRHFAQYYGFRIVYIPMVQLSKASMNRLRTMHLLADRSFRDDAREFIGF